MQNNNYPNRFMGYIKQIDTKKTPRGGKVIFIAYRPTKPLSKHMVILMKDISLLTHTKMMWRDLLSFDNSEIIKGLWVIGEKENIAQWLHLVNAFNSLSDQIRSDDKSNREEYTLSVGFGSIRSYSSSKIRTLISYIHFRIKELLETDIKYNLWLEETIKEKFSLDYKLYKTDVKLYYNAISNIYHHKRMIL